MFDISVQAHVDQLRDDEYLTQLAQLGVDALDITTDQLPGVEETGYPDPDGLSDLQDRVRDYGLRINRVTLPGVGGAYMEGNTDDPMTVKNSVRALEIFADAGIPIARQRFAGGSGVVNTSETHRDVIERYEAVQRGGLRSRGERLRPVQTAPTDGSEGADTETLGPTREALDAWWGRFYNVYDELVPVADEQDIKLAMHPSDTPTHDAPFDSVGLNRITDRYPSPQVGFIYCVGTRAEAGGSATVLDELKHFGRKDRLFLVHVRNIRGSLASAGRFEETLLDDGDLDIYRILETLDSVGFSGCINPDHVPTLAGDTEHSMISWGYGVAYLKAMGAALASSKDPRRG